MFKTLKADIDAVMERDPAARSRAEVFFLYSGFKAVRSHRKANWCLRHNLKFLARWISQRSRHKTGIEIHPGATIGKGLFIDHGMGVVIGETTIIGDNCTIYQNVTLGGTGKETGKRHPTLGNNVLVGSGAKVLGPFKVGDNARIAAGAVVLSEVPPNATAVGVPARVVKVNGVRSETLDQIHVSDPVALALCNLEHKIFELQKQLDELKAENKADDDNQQPTRAYAGKIASVREGEGDAGGNPHQVDHLFSDREADVADVPGKDEQGAEQGRTEYQHCRGLGFKAKPGKHGFHSLKGAVADEQAPADSDKDLVEGGDDRHAGFPKGEVGCHDSQQGIGAVSDQIQKQPVDPVAPAL